MSLKNKKSPTTFTISDFYCVCCSTKGMPIPRKANRHREKGHLKKLYCIKCKIETNHMEIRPFDYNKEQFMSDFKEGKFKEVALYEQVC